MKYPFLLQSFTKQAAPVTVKAHTLLPLKVEKVIKILGKHNKIIAVLVIATQLNLELHF